MEAGVNADRSSPNPGHPGPTGSRTLLVALLLGSALVSGCGRPATLDECNEIVKRITELELKSKGSAGRSAEMVRETIDALSKTTMKDCVGRRIDDGAMACVRTASDAQQLVKECF
jgi:hypothetical protein